MLKLIDIQYRHLDIFLSAEFEQTLRNFNNNREKNFSKTVNN